MGEGCGEGRAGWGKGVVKEGHGVRERCGEGRAWGEGRAGWRKGVVKERRGGGRLSCRFFTDCFWVSVTSTV